MVFSTRECSMVVRKVRACNLSSISRSLFPLLISASLLLCDLISVVVDGKNFSVLAPLSEFVIEFAQAFGCLSWTWLARLWCHDYLFKSVFHVSAPGALRMTEFVCLSWSCSFSLSMVSRSLAFIVCIYWRLRQSANYDSKVVATNPQRASVIVTDVEHHAKTHIDSVQSFNIYKVCLPHASVFFSFSVGSVIYVHGAHFARQRQRVYDLVLKSKVDDVLVKT